MNKIEVLSVRNAPSGGPDYIFTERYVAKMLSLSLPTFRKLVSNGDGPNRIRLSKRRIGYSARDVESWLNERTETPTSIKNDGDT